MNFTGPVNVNAGGLAFSTTGALLGGQVILAGNTVLDARGLSGTIGSFASTATTAVVMNGLQGTAGTVTAGLDNANSTFAGTFSSPYPTGLLNIAKIGSGNLTLTNDSSATNSGTLTVNGGTVTVGGANGRLGFTTYTLNAGGTLALGDGGASNDNRLGGATLTPTVQFLSPTYRSLNFNGGTLTLRGSGATAEAIGSITSLTGGGILSVDKVDVTIGQMAAQAATGALLIRGAIVGLRSVVQLRFRAVPQRARRRLGAHTRPGVLRHAGRQYQRHAHPPGARGYSARSVADRLRHRLPHRGPRHRPGAGAEPRYGNGEHADHGHERDHQRRSLERD